MLAVARSKSVNTAATTVRATNATARNRPKPGLAATATTMRFAARLPDRTRASATTVSWLADSAPRAGFHSPGFSCRATVAAHAPALAAPGTACQNFVAFKSPLRCRPIEMEPARLGQWSAPASHQQKAAVQYRDRCGSRHTPKNKSKLTYVKFYRHLG